MGGRNREAAQPDGDPAAVASYRLGAVNRFKFLRPVRPGSELRIETRMVSEAGGWLTLRQPCGSAANRLPRANWRSFLPEYRQWARICCGWNMPSNEERGHRGWIRKRFSLQGLRSFLALMFAERLEPGRASAAVFIGVFIAIVPIYGFQSLVAWAWQRSCA